MNKKNSPEVSPELLSREFTTTENVIFRRRSVRLYQKKQVPEFMIKRVLEAGRFAPSAGNAQPWKFIVLRDDAIIDEMTRNVVRLLKVFRAVLD